MPNVIKTIKKKRTNENYQQILNNYVKNNSDILSTNRTNKINSSFFDNITNNNIQKNSKLLNIFKIISQINNQIILKEYFTQWKNTEKETNIIENNIENDINDNILNKNKKINIINQKDEIKKENEIEINNINFFKEIKNNENQLEIPKKVLDSDDNIFPSYDEVNNNSIKIEQIETNLKKDDININNNEKKEIIKNEKKEKLENQIIDDDFDIKLNEEMILNVKDNSKVKSDIFDSNDINTSSLYLKDKSNINENISNYSQEKIKNEIKGENIETNNEICNITNTNTNRNSINHNKSISGEMKDIKLNEEEIIDNNKIINKIKEKREKFKEEIRKTFNKNFLFDSLENNKVSYNSNLSLNENKPKTDLLIKTNTLNNINKQKIKILNHFMTENSKTKVEKEKATNKALKRCFYKISTTNKIQIKNKEDNNIKEKNGKNSFYNTNLIKIENIFIKGNKNNKETKTVNNNNKKLELFIIDKNNDIYINQSKKDNQKELIKNYDLILDNNIIKNNLCERIIDSNMITNFLNNTKNEPMFTKKNYSTIQNSGHNSKINLNINNIINFSINKSNIKETKVKTEENKNNKNTSFNSFNNNFVYERKNHFYLKKHINIGNYNKININNKRSYSNRINKTNNLKLNEIELIEPNIQKCPVSLRKEQNSFYEERKSNSLIKDNKINYIKKENNKNINNNKQKRKLPRSLSTEFINGKINNKKKTSKEKYNTTYNSNNNNNNNKTNFISEDLLNFIDCIKTNQEKEKIKVKEKIQLQKNVYNFNEIKYNKINTYREKNKKQSKNSSLIVDSFKRIYNYKLNIHNNQKSIKENNKENISIEKNNKNRNVDYKRLNELYLDYKIKDIKRNKLRNEQDSNRGITFFPHINKKNF